MLYALLAVLAGLAITLAGTMLYFRGKATSQAEELRKLKSVASTTSAELDRVRVRFAPVLDLDVEERRLREAIAQLEVERRRVGELAEKEKGDLSSQYAAALATFERLRSEVAVLEESVEDLSFGLYKPHFDFQSSEEFKAAIETTRAQQRELVHSGSAVSCPEEWTVGGSVREGRRMAKQYMKLVLRAFNAEADAAIANVSWNNVGKMEERIRKSFDALNALGTVVKVQLSSTYRNARLDELRLVFEHEEKRRAEREEQRRIREQIREEERAQRELAKAQEEAAKEEERFQKALDRARAEAASASGGELDKLSSRIASLEAELKKAQEQRQRAKSMAELTKSGYVYVISNVGSFGENVFKVGMTRRLEPLERVHELGDASVPFPFDVHAMLYSDNAPELESALHEHLRPSSVNLVNPRREFFLAELHDIEEFAKVRGVQVEFTQVAEAREYRESVAMREAARSGAKEEAVPFPTDPFARTSAPQDAGEHALAD